MAKNLLLIALRLLLKQKTNSIIKIGGLSVGFTCCVLIVLYVHFEYSYDSFHTRRNNIFRIVEDTETSNGTVQRATAAGPVGPTLVTEFAEVIRYARFEGTSMLMKYGENHFQEDRLYFADSTVFDLFTFPLIDGDPRTALARPQTIVLTKTAAQRYFHGEDPMGKEMMIDNEIPFTVTGIMEDVPGNSHLQFDMLLSLSTRGSKFLNTWTWGAYTYIEAEPSAVDKILEQFTSVHNTELLSEGVKKKTLTAQALEDIHLYSKRAGEAGVPGNASNLLLYSVVALLILIIACVNFINLTTAQAATRAREVGIRKVVGGTSGQLANQFLTESLLLSVAAALIAFALSYLLLPMFSGITGTPMSFAPLYNPIAIGIFALSSMLIGCLAGWYPALVLSGFRPAGVLKGTFKTQQAGFLREGLIVIQFSISIALVVGTIAIFSQLNFMRTKDLGYDKEQVLVIYFGDDGDVQEKTETIKQELLRNGFLRGATSSSHVPGRDVGKTRIEMTSVDGENRSLDVSLFAVDHEFIPFYKLELVAGRAFSTGMDSDGLMVNESALRQLGFEKPEDIVGRETTVRGVTGRVIGVIKDFHYASLHKTIEPMLLRMRAKSLSFISLKIEAGGASMIPTLEEQWKQLAPTRPFDYFFLDEQFDRQYRADQQFGRLFGASAIISIVLACLGLFGLVSFIVEQRTKEIGIRKVLGASVSGVVALLSTNFMKLIGISIIIASSVSWYVMDRWLEAFPYRIEMQWWMFVIAGGMGLIVALLTISLKSIKAAMADPVKSLRSE